MTVSVPPGTSSSDLVAEVLDDLFSRLSDQYGYQSTSTTTPTQNGINYELSPRADIEVIDRGEAVVFKLHGFREVDEDDFLTGVSSTIEQRHGGVRVEIG
ncbi:MAG: hypothetical protein M3O32_16740, partial [Actinomycetota bacterium]|nr:hypothetical protein [Actinomycetota bacterium]